MVTKNIVIDCPFTSSNSPIEQTQADETKI